MSQYLDRLNELHQYVRVGKQPPITLTYDSEWTEAIGQAAAEMTRLEDKHGKMKSALAVYSNEYFYDELPPSKAKDDRGAIARATLAAVEGV